MSSFFPRIALLCTLSLCLGSEILFADLIFYEPFDEPAGKFVKKMPDWRTLKIYRPGKTRYVVEEKGLVAPEATKLAPGKGNRCVMRDSAAENGSIKTQRLIRTFPPVGPKRPTGISSNYIYISMLIEIETYAQGSWIGLQVLDSQVRNAQGNIAVTPENAFFVGKTKWFEKGFGVFRSHTKPPWTEVPAESGKPHLLVVRYDFLNSVMSVWVDPVCGQETPPASDAELEIPEDTGKPWKLQAVDAIVLETQVLSKDKHKAGDPGAISFDEIRVGTTWKDVTPTADGDPPAGNN